MNTNHYNNHDNSDYIDHNKLCYHSIFYLIEISRLNQYLVCEEINKFY